MYTNDDLLDLARRYLRAIEEGVPADEMRAFFAEDVVQEEFPNRFVPDGARRDLAALMEAGARGRAVVESQRYQIVNSVVSPPWVALEVAWQATLKVPIGSLPAGGIMRARFGPMGANQSPLLAERQAQRAKSKLKSMCCWKRRTCNALECSKSGGRVCRVPRAGGMHEPGIGRRMGRVD